MVTSRSPLKSTWLDPRVVYFSLNLLDPIDKVVEAMKPYCADVTHAYFTSYVHVDDFSKLKDLNIPLFENFLVGIDTVARNTLSRVCLQTGGKVRVSIHLQCLYPNTGTSSTMASTWVLSPMRHAMKN